MKKRMITLLAMVFFANISTFAMADAVTANLVSVEDFEDLEVGTYTGNDIIDLGPKLGYVNVASGCTLEVCQEADGNKYLKATLSEYAAFGYYFGTDNARKYAYMTFDYKFPSAGGNANFASYAHTGATSGSPSFLNGENSWGISSYSTDSNATEWTQAKGKNYTNAYSACIGITPAQGGGNRVIYVDNIIVWEFNKPVGETHNSSAPATVTFANSTQNEGDITMPEAYTGIAWCNLYNAQSSNCTIDLSQYTPVGEPVGKGFAGWSLTDGGNVIKSTMYNAFKIPGDITLYAVWEEGFDITNSSVSNDEANERTSLRITFNTPAKKETAENLSNYSIDGLNILSATLTGDGLSCILMFDRLIPEGEEYTLVVSGVMNHQESVIEGKEINFIGTYVEQAPILPPDGTQNGLVEVEDFESYEVGAYTGEKILDLGPVLGNVNIAPGSVLEICQEEDGNKYLKATMPEYAAFGYYFGTEDDRKYAYMTFDYKFPTAEGNANFASYGHTGATTGSPSYLNGENSWSISEPSTDSTTVEWKEAKGKNYTNAYSACMGIAVVQGGGNRVIYVDNIIVWEFELPVAETHNSSIPAAVTFKNSKGYTGDVTMPGAYSGIIWCNLYSAQGANCTINLNNYTPTGAPAGKKFAGWSLTDGGNVIKDTMYHSFKVPGNITLYAVWEDKFDVVNKTVFNDTTLERTNLVLTFNRPAKKEFAEDNTNYILSGASVVSATLSEDGLSCTLEFDRILSADENYTLTIYGVKDLNDDMISGTNVTFSGVIRLKVPALHFYKDYETASSVQITDGRLQSGTLSVVAEGIELNSEIPKLMTIVIALYRDESLIELRLQSTSVCTGTPVKASIIVPNDLNDGDYLLKTFVIESFANSEPLSETIASLRENNQ